MDTPILDMLSEYSERDILRLHMPAHKGRLDKFDITEVEGADSLFDANGIIKRSEENAGKIFGADSFYSTEGSSLSIRAMVYLSSLYAKERGASPLILAARNAHKSFLSAVALCDTDVEWMLPKDSPSYLSCPLTKDEVERAIDRTSPTAVYITSPDYLGRTVNIKEIAEVCHKKDVLLLVDNAHGAYLKFLDPSRHPIDLGADMCCDSAHKTLEALGGAGYLHISRTAPRFFKENAKSAMSLFASTSPSYLILASLDRLNALLASEFSCVLQSFVVRIEDFCKKIEELGFKNVSEEPLKITIDTAEYGYTGDEIAEILIKNNIVCEFHDKDYLVMMLSPYMTDGEIERLYCSLKAIPKREAIKKGSLPLTLPKRVLSPREAILSPSETVSAKECLGRVLASVTVGCPPAVPIIVSGEMIDENTLEVSLYYGTERFTVVK